MPRHLRLIDNSEMRPFSFPFNQYTFYGNVDDSARINGPWPDIFTIWDNFRYVREWAAPESVKQDLVTPGTSRIFYYGDMETSIDWVMEGSPPLSYDECAELIQRLGWRLQEGHLTNRAFYATISEGSAHKLGVTVEKIPNERATFRGRGTKPSTRTVAALFPTDVLPENDVRNVIQQGIDECISRGLINPIAQDFNVKFKSSENGDSTFMSVVSGGYTAQVGLSYIDLQVTLQALQSHYRTTAHWCSMTGHILEYVPAYQAEFAVLRIDVGHWYEGQTNEIASVDVSSQKNTTASISTD